ncbi:hypothetical protein V3C99_009603 [Haemonchus contortus]
MNPIALVATLCLAYSVAGRRCLTDGELEYKLFQDLDPSYQELLRKTYNKDFYERDLVLSYKVVPQDGGAGFDLDGANNFFPSVILSRSDRIKQPIYFNQTSLSTVERSGPIKFIRDLYNCTAHSAHLDDSD